VHVRKMTAERKAGDAWVNHGFGERNGAVTLSVGVKRKGKGGRAFVRLGVSVLSVGTKSACFR
jgi:hypothetical protein